MRFVLAVFEAIREVWPESKPLGVRISATDWAEGGWSVDDSVVLARKLKGLGCDYIAASSGGVPEQKITLGPGYQVPFAERIRRRPNRDDGGRHDPGAGLRGIARRRRQGHGRAARGLLYNPRWPARGRGSGRPGLILQYARSQPRNGLRRSARLAAEREDE
jgi:2,4-dienoyl-CoA reductase-like NADH-dependent reductase (Old Yellow Enzyme family)